MEDLKFDENALVKFEQVKKIVKKLEVDMEGKYLTNPFFIIINYFRKSFSTIY